MVDEIVKLASVLNAPNLEPETLQAINQAIRERLDVKAVQAPQTPEDAAKKLLGTDVFTEWTEGGKGGG